MAFCLRRFTEHRAPGPSTLGRVSDSQPFFLGARAVFCVSVPLLMDARCLLLAVGSDAARTVGREPGVGPARVATRSLGGSLGAPAPPPACCTRLQAPRAS